MKRYAIILSCEEYEHDNIYPKTWYCHEDAYLLKEALVNYCDFAEQDIYNEALSSFNDKEPQKILDKIEETVENSQEGDTILFYYAGHGEYQEGDSYLILPKTEQNNIKQTAISIRDINRILKKKNRINVRIFDCCHSGLDARSSSELAKSERDFARTINEDNQGWFTFASCKAEQLSYPDSNVEHGIFTYYLVEAIKEYEKGTKIMPEILKVKICDKVAEWCKDKGKTQTPVFNASIDGNISFAIRKKEEIIQKRENNILDLKEQIKLLRKNKKNSCEVGKENLKKYIDEIITSLKNNKNMINTFGLDIEENDALSVNDLGEDFEYIKEAIVKYLNNKGHSSFHEYSIQEHYEEDNRPSFLTGTFPRKPKLVSTDYIIKQPYNFPKCYTYLKIIKDDYLEEASIFVYVCPLQFTTCIILGIDINERVVELHSVIIKVEDKINNINDIIIKLINRFNELYIQSVKKCIKAYNEEIKVLSEQIDV